MTFHTQNLVLCIGPKHSYKRAVGTIHTVGYGVACRTIFLSRYITLVHIRMGL